MQVQPGCRELVLGVVGALWPTALADGREEMIDGCQGDELEQERGAGSGSNIGACLLC